MWSKGNPPTVLVGKEISTMMETNRKLPQKLKLELLCDPVIPLQSVYGKEIKSTYEKKKNTCSPTFMTALCTTAKTKLVPIKKGTGEENVK